MKRWIPRTFAVPALILVAAFVAGIWNLVSESRPRAPVMQMVIIHSALDKYKADFGAFPSGDSQAISRALLGDNPKKVQFVSLRNSTTNLVDPWGTPYFIYFSGDEVLVRSAGPNKRFDSSGDEGFDDFIR